MRLPVLLILVLGAAGCTNRVISYQPLFKRDRVAEGSIHRGVWASPGPGCALDSTQPVQAWPECANPSLIGRNSFSANEFLAGGEPLIVQSRFQSRDKPTHYAYTAIQPLARNAEGLVTSFKMWAVECGPPDIVGEGEAREVRVTRSPLPGLTLEDENCVARAPGPVREAAHASQAWGSTITLQWQRPARRSDKTRFSGWSADPLASVRKVEEAPAPPAP